MLTEKKSDKICTFGYTYGARTRTEKINLEGTQGRTTLTETISFPVVIGELRCSASSFLNVV